MSFPHPFPFDPTYGYALEMLRQVPAPSGPTDFAPFWRDTYERTLAVDPQPTMRPIPCDDPSIDLREVEYTSLGGFRVGGWIVARRDRELRSGAVVGHGYGGRDAPELYPPGSPDVAIFPCARGFHRSARPGLPSGSVRHVIHGIQSRDTYLHRFCVADLFAATSALLALHPELGDLRYLGGSFGGGMGALFLPWEPRITRGFLDIPSFGNHPLRLTLPCVGSGEAVRLYHNRRGGVMEVLRYFDAATAASFIQAPTLVAAALFDPAVPPPGQFAVYNAIPAEKRLFIRQAAHFDFSGSAEDDRQLREQLDAWFAPSVR